MVIFFRNLVFCGLSLAFLMPVQPLLALQKDDQILAESTREATGLWFGSVLEAQSLGGESGLLWSIGVGGESPYVAARFSLPLFLQIDPPLSGDLPHPLCGWLRCEGLIDDRGWVIHGLSRWVEDLRLGRPDSVFYLRGGPLHLRLGQGLTVDGYTNGLIWDLRQSGLYARIAWPDKTLFAQLFSANLLGPASIMGIRLNAAGGDFWPMWRLEEGFFGRLADLEMGTSFVVDPLVPYAASALSETGQVLTNDKVRALMVWDADLHWPMVPKGGLFEGGPVLGGSLVYGLSERGDENPGLGYGVAAGLKLALRLPWTGILFSSQVGHSSAAHSFALFDVFYEAERRMALYGTAESGVSLLRVPRPAGWDQSHRIDLQLGEWGRWMARVHQVPGDRHGLLETGLEVAMGPVRAAAHVARRGPTETWFDQSAATHAVLEAAYNFWGPWSVTAKGWRALHFEGTRAGWIPYTDVMIGIAAEMNLAVD